MSNFFFPLEVIVEILQRLPVKSLAICMCVSKAWKSIITTDSFITSHHYHLQTNHANNSSLFFHLFTGFREIPDSVDPRRYFDGFYSLNSEGDVLFFWKSPSVRTFGTCNGLVCFSDHSKPIFTQFVIMNPSIHKYVQLPKPSITFQVRDSILDSDRIFCGFGYDSRNHDFKVVRCITPPYEEATPQAEIYSLASHSWKTITVVASPFDVNNDGEHKFVNGVMHWVAFRTINGMTYNFILTFDIAEEIFGELMLPQCLKESIFDVCILLGGDLLAVIHKKHDSCHGECCEIWIMEEYGVVESWNRWFHFPTNENVVALRNSGEVVLEPSDEIIFRDPINGVEKKLALEHGIMFVDHYVESLFLINGKNARTQLSL